MAYVVAARARPTAVAPMVMRPESSAAIAQRKPVPSGPIRSLAGTRTPSRTSSTVGDARSPIFRSFLPKDSPGASPGTRNALTPDAPGPPVRAIRT